MSDTPRRHQSAVARAIGALTEPKKAPEQSETMRRVDAVLASLRDMLARKNKAYGDSALQPIRIFSMALAEEQIRVRLDDKLSRLMRGHEYGDEDTIVDIAGYMILLLAARLHD